MIPKPFFLNKSKAQLSGWAFLFFITDNNCDRFSPNNLPFQGVCSAIGVVRIAHLPIAENKLPFQGDRIGRSNALKGQPTLNPSQAQWHIGATMQSQRCGG